MYPIAIGIKFGFGESFVKRDRIKFAKFASLFPGVAFDLKSFERFLIRKMTKKCVCEFVEKKKAEIVVGF